MSHLGRWLSALIDGELEPVERDRVLNHLAGCEPCLHDANAMRALKRRLTALSETEGADAAIASRLIELARCDHEPDDEDTPWGTPFPQPYPEGRRSPYSRSRHQMPAWLMFAGTTGTAIIAFGFAAFLLGSGQGDAPAPKITPSVDSFLLQHYYDTGVEPAARTGSGMPGAPDLDNPAMLDVGQAASGRARPARPEGVPGGDQIFVGQLVAGESAPARSTSGQPGQGLGLPSSVMIPIASAPGTALPSDMPTVLSPSASGPPPGSHRQHRNQ
jgi:Putative zinc-finger